MTDWQIIYLATQVLYIVVLGRIVFEAGRIIHETSRDGAFRRVQILSRVFLLIASTFVLKEIFWAIVILFRDWLPLFLHQALPLVAILAIIQLTTAGLMTYLWDFLFRRQHDTLD
jgi:hypothetical protein